MGMHRGFSSRVAADLADVTFRQLDYWARTDLIRPSLADAKGSGSRRRYALRDVYVLAACGYAMREVRLTGSCAPMARELGALPVDRWAAEYVLAEHGPLRVILDLSAVQAEVDERLAGCSVWDVSA